jgi:hypothetical protein
VTAAFVRVQGSFWDFWSPTAYFWSTKSPVAEQGIAPHLLWPVSDRHSRQKSQAFFVSSVLSYNVAEGLLAVSWYVTCVTLLVRTSVCQGVASLIVKVEAFEVAYSKKKGRRNAAIRIASSVRILISVQQFVGDD